MNPSPRPAGLRAVRSRVVPLVVDDIDTDQIIPARFLKVTTKEGLGEKLFCDWRYDESGAKKAEFILNDPAVQGAEVLLAGQNFGCGSSREHAPWALRAWGLRVVVARSFADIFKTNALKCGLLPVALDEAPHARLVALVRADPAAELSVDVAAQTVSLPDGSTATFPIDAFAKHCLVEGVDELGYLLSLAPQIAEHERRRGPRQ